MTLDIPMPRLLPATIVVLALVLMMKSLTLVGGLSSSDGRPEAVAVVSSAVGAEHLQEPPKPVPTALRSPAATAAGKQAVASAEPTQPSPPAAAEAPVSDSEKALLQDLRQRRKELDARADAITAREAVLGATEQKLGARVAELQQLQKRLEGLESAQKQKEETGWQGLVKLYEAMKPREAATIFNELSMPVLLQVLDRMKDTKAAAVLAAMSPDKARDVTSELATMRTGRDPSLTGLPGAAVPRASGG
jgi:flagellar motility protein MotE (MotC chaperone)